VALSRKIPRPARCKQSHSWAQFQRKQLIDDGTLINKDGLLVFTKDAEFASPSGAAAVIHGGSANGLTAWKTENGTSLKQLDEQDLTS
jgi:hypothetical protein